MITRGQIFEAILTLRYRATAGARRSSVVRAFAHGAMGHRIDPSWGGHIELFLVPASAPWYVLLCLWDDAYKRTLAANRKEYLPHVAAAGFLSHYLSGLLPHV